LLKNSENIGQGIIIEYLEIMFSGKPKQGFWKEENIAEGIWKQKYIQLK
jgi:hypothetical protein